MKLYLFGGAEVQLGQVDALTEFLTRNNYFDRKYFR